MVVAFEVLFHCLIYNKSIPFIIPTYQVSEEVKGLEPAQDMKEDRADEDIVPRQAENVGDMKPAKDDVQSNLANESEELKSKLSVMDSKLREVRAHEFRLDFVAVTFMSSFLLHVPLILCYISLTILLPKYRNLITLLS